MRHLMQLPNDFIHDYVSRPRVGPNIKKHLETLFAKTKCGWKRKLLALLIELHKDFDLRVISPEQICDLVRRTKGLVKNMNTPAYKKFCKEIASAFSYNGAVRWLLERGRIYTVFSSLRYCPYCNAETVYAIKINNRAVRSDIDHFFPQSKYPFLAISVYNWIPACTRCNCRLKQDDDPDSIAMPYIDDVHNGVCFDVVINKIEGFGGCKDSGTYTVKALKRARCALSDKAAGFIDFFGTEEVYSKMFGWEIADFMNRINLLSCDYKRWVKMLLKGVDVNSLFWHDIPDEDDINQSRLSKLKLDMLRQFGF